MLYFENDYSEGAAPEVMGRLLETNPVSQPGYGEDEYTLRAVSLIRKALGAPEADIFFISGGTQTNALAIGGLLRPWEGVVAAGTGHINVHEAGAVEFTGHKVMTIPGVDGKLDPEALRRYLAAFHRDPNREHMVYPGMVYISHPTEYGTLYTSGELRELAEICRLYSIPLYMDGARLAYALGAGPGPGLSEIAELCDVFYIGGTKCGALCGEALVFPKGAPEHFLTVVKQRGALLAKGRLCGAQFEALFEDGLYERLGRRTVELAMRLKDGLLSRGIELFVDSPTNQQFIVADEKLLRALDAAVRYSYWEPVGEGRHAIRLAVSWATPESSLDELFAVIDAALSEKA